MVYRHNRSHSLARSLLWRTHVIGLKLIKGKYDHISKCWTLISTGRSRCPTLLYWVNTDINSIILILQCLRCVAFCNLIQFSELDYSYQRASSWACSPILFWYEAMRYYTLCVFSWFWEHVGWCYGRSYPMGNNRQTDFVITRGYAVITGYGISTKLRLMRAWIVKVTTWITMQPKEWDDE